MNLANLTETELKEALMLKEKLDNYAVQEKCQESFFNYVEHIWPEFICGRHHKIFAKKLQLVAEGKLKRLIVNKPITNQLDVGKPIKVASILLRVLVER